MKSEWSTLPPALEDLVEEVLDATGLSGGARSDVERDLRAHFEDGLAAGVSGEEMIHRFGDPQIAGQRIAEVGLAAIGGLAGAPSGSGRGSGFGWDAIWTEFRFACRALVRAPMFTALVLTTLALGVGANTAVFSVLDAVLLRPLPYAEPNELVRVEETYEEWAGTSEFTRAPVVNAMRTWDDVFTDVATIYTYRETGVDLTGGDRPERVVASRVSAGYFETLGAAPILGRTFREDESFGPGEFRSGEPQRLAVLSHGLWTRRFGADRQIVGRTVELDGVAVEVLGVMSRDFNNPFGSPADLWVPQDLRFGGSNGWGNYYLSTVARLRGGTPLETAQARVDAHVAGVREAEPDSGPWGAVLVPLQTHIVGSARRSMLWMLAAAVALVLLSACVNVGNLVFARSLDREREVALRGALGSRRGRLVGHLLTENAVLAVGGSVLGLALGLLGVRALLSVAPDALPDLVQPGLSPGVFGFALLAMVASLVIFGLAPTLRLSRVPPASVLRAGGRGGTEGGGLRRIRATLVVAQVAVALVLMIGAGLLVRSFAAIRDVPLGVEPDQLLTFEVHLPLSRYPEGADREAFHALLQDRIEALPGTVSAAATSWLPLNGRYHIWGAPRRLGEDAPEGVSAGGWAADVRIVNGDYFQTMGIEQRAGASPAEVDPAGEDVVWISEGVAERLFPDRDPIGERIWAINAERRVVGIVGDVAWEARGSMAPTVYTLHAQYAHDRNWALTHVVRGQGDLDVLRGAIQQELRGLDANLVMFRARPFQRFVELARAQDRFALFLMSAFAVLAMTLAAVGTYGILAGSVAKRTREIGIRMALGANAGLVRWSVMRSAFGMVAGGVLLGALLAWIGGRWLSAFLFEVQPRDPITYVSAVALIVGLGAAASFLPARRATRIDPARSLAEE